MRRAPSSQHLRGNWIPLVYFLISLIEAPGYLEQPCFLRPKLESIGYPDPQSKVAVLVGLSVTVQLLFLFPSKYFTMVSCVFLSYKVSVYLLFGLSGRRHPKQELEASEAPASSIGVMIFRLEHGRSPGSLRAVLFREHRTLSILFCFRVQIAFLSWRMAWRLNWRLCRRKEPFSYDSWLFLIACEFLALFATSKGSFLENGFSSLVRGTWLIFVFFLFACWTNCSQVSQRKLFLHLIRVDIWELLFEVPFP